MICKYCGISLTERDIKRNETFCCGCANKLPTIRRFIQACNEFKSLVNYNAILKKREREKKRREGKK